MSEDTINTTLFTESPASWNTRYVTADGFTCQLTLRAENGKDLLERANSALEYLTEQGCIPFYGYSRGNGYQQADKSTNGNGSKGENLCPIHNVELKRWEKSGKIWFSHNTEDGWCYGKVKNNK